MSRATLKVSSKWIRKDDKESFRKTRRSLVSLVSVEETILVIRVNIQSDIYIYIYEAPHGEVSQATE